MCGIFAAMSRRPLTDRQIADALQSLHHRGPDETGVWTSENARWTLGHTRLSIIGLSNGTQPVSATDDMVHLVANGEFYGYQTIRKELLETGAVLRTDSDSEIALHLYLRRGLSALDRLRGEFAFVLADERRDMMIAVRDRFGIKPLYYAQVDGEIFFASEIKTLLKMGVPAKWHFPGALGGIGRPHEITPFKAIRSVPPGHYAIAQEGRIRIYPYWDWEFPNADDLAKDDRSDEEVVDGFRSVLQDAVRERLVADVEVACYLSGGIDSCAVLGLAQRETSRPIKAFCLNFAENLYNEGAIAEKQAEFVGANYVPIPLRGRDIADNFRDAVRHSEMPMFNGHGVAKYILSREVQTAGIKVVFTGEGADEMLGGYTPFRVDAITHNPDLGTQQKDKLIASIFGTNEATRALFLPDQVDSEDLRGVEGRLGWIPSFKYTQDGLIRNFAPILRSDAAAEFAAYSPMCDALDRMPITQRLSGRDKLNQALYLCAKSQLPTMILNYLGDRMEMAHSIEGRVPFLDHHVAEFAAQMPVNLKVKGAREKHVLREAAKNVLIPEVYDREKHPFTSPPSRSPEDPMIGFYRDTFASKAAQDQPMFDMVKVDRLIDDYLESPPDQQIALEGTLQVIASLVAMQDIFAIGN